LNFFAKKDDYLFFFREICLSNVLLLTKLI